MRDRVVIEVDRESLLKLIERLRREKGLTFKEIAKQLKISIPYARYLARGKVKDTLSNKYFSEYVNLIIRGK
ncbi:MAG: hypothetical protein QW607_07635 [Desulfurococcaceae archaeon]